MVTRSWLELRAARGLSQFLVLRKWDCPALSKTPRASLTCWHDWVRIENVARTSKSPSRVLKVAYRIAQSSLPAYSHPCSPKKFTQHQLFACLVLKKFLKTDYRGVVAVLQDCPSLTEVIHLQRIPHFSTLQKASRRLLMAPQARRLLATTVSQHMKRKKRVQRAAMDSTGLESSPASPYFVRRRAAAGSPWKSMVYHRFPKLAILCNTDSHFVLGFRTGRGPLPDVVDFQPLLSDTLQRVRLTSVLADAGYDSEANHVFGRETCQVRTIIPAKRGRPGAKPARGRYRRLMQTRFDTKAYQNRCQVETVVSMIKRRQGSYLRCRTYWGQCRDLRLKVLTHNIMILRRP
jgi:Transposase DDE domain